MITLKNDKLSSRFPQISDSLRRLVEQHVETTLPKILAGDREAALSHLRSKYGYKHAERSQQVEAERQILHATRESIETALRRLSFERAGLSRAGSLAALDVVFHRTLRIPDDGKLYPLPAGLGRFLLRLIDDFKATVDPTWLERGGVLMPMYQSEALWIQFTGSYPFAVKVGAGKINAVTGEGWGEGLQKSPQNYLVVPQQPWVDGFAVRKGVIRQFVAMPLGAGYSVEEQITGAADVGGLQLQVYPMKAEAYFRSRVADRLPKSLEDLVDELVTVDLGHSMLFAALPRRLSATSLRAASAMGLGAGGTMRQEIYSDPNSLQDWDQSVSSRCFVHLCNSLVWRQITGANPPHPPFTAKEYAASGVPWFDYYRDDLAVLPGSAILDGVKSVFNLGEAKGEKPLTDNSPLEPIVTIQYGNSRRPDEVREWAQH